MHGGYIGDSSADISYSNICKQIDKGLKEQHTERKVIRAVMRVIQPGYFKNILICEDELTTTEFKSFLRSHIGEKGTAELFKELLLAIQLENETPQQLLYGMLGLKQNVIFTSNMSLQPTQVQHLQPPSCRCANVSSKPSLPKRGKQHGTTLSCLH